MLIGRQPNGGLLEFFPMRMVDPYTLRMRQPREVLIFSASQIKGEQETQEDYFLNFNDECFALADGVGSMPNGEYAAKFASETAIWAYKHIRQHRFYWLDKKLFMKRIFRTTNMMIWQKRRENEFQEGLATTLMVAMVGSKNYWLGTAGDSTAWLVHSGAIQKLTKEENPFDPHAKKLLGMKRLGLIPDFVSGQFNEDDVLVLATDGCANYTTPQDLLSSVSLTGTTVEDMNNAVTTLLKSAATNGSKENMTAIMIKRIALR